jgi:hypothetical protein
LTFNVGEQMRKKGNRGKRNYLLNFYCNLFVFKYICLIFAQTTFVGPVRWGVTVAATLAACGVTVGGTVGTGRTRWTVPAAATAVGTTPAYPPTTDATAFRIAGTVNNLHKWADSREFVNKLTLYR